MTFRKTLAWAGLLLAPIAFTAFLAIAIGVWIVTATLQRRIDDVLGEANAALDRARPIAGVIREALETAEAEVKTARPANADTNVPAMQKMLLRSALKETPGRVATATRAVEAMGDLLVVAQVALDTVQATPGAVPTPAGDLARLREKLTGSAAALQRADAILRSTPGTSTEYAAEDARTIENALAQSRAVVTEVDDKFTHADAQIATLRVAIPQQLGLLTWVIFVLSLMGALGQMALVRWCWACRSPKA